MDLHLSYLLEKSMPHMESPAHKEHDGQDWSLLFSFWRSGIASVDRIEPYALQHGFTTAMQRLSLCNKSTRILGLVRFHADHRVMSHASRGGLRNRLSL